ncbi:MAG: hypothetical protein JNJ46_10175 [Myxococcales bacterium]|nr:hypothetical protein [Myxococcales bacterium]
MAKKAPDDNERRQKQGASFSPLRETKPYQSAKPLAQPADPIAFPSAGWVKLHSEPPPFLAASWKLLTWQARGLYRLLLTQCDSDGVIPLGKVGLRGIAGLVIGPWDAIEPFAQELVANEWLVWDDSGQLLAVAWFRESQEKRQTAGAKRQAEYRERQGQRP